MPKHSITFTVLFYLISAGAVGEEYCEKCVHLYNCPEFNNMNIHDQRRWLTKFPCQQQQEDESRILYGFSPLARGDYVCCPGSTVWSIVNEEQRRGSNYPLVTTYFPRTYDQKYNHNSFGYTERHGGRRIDNVGNTFSNQYPSYAKPGQLGFNNQNFNKLPVQQNPRENFPTLNNPSGFTIPGNIPKSPPNVKVTGFLPNGKTVNELCQATTIIPPDPDTGCCGLDVSGVGGITDLQKTISERVSYSNLSTNKIKMQRETQDGTVEIQLDNRIAGGSETELEQFPWTVYLKITFDNGKNKTTFNCGGSIISSRYILTAAHCIYDKSAKLSNLEIYMAEYDKRTFPRDCKLGSNGEESCISNVLMYSEGIIIHHGYDDHSLNNDIALIRIRGSAPYTEYIRPICLPSINVDNEVFYDLPLPVAGWGRNGPYVSEVKQSTVVNLVPRNECRRFYPQLAPSHLCAVGKTGEDTCKGDSGGPLMMLHGGIYYVVGVVSGKRADVPCGASVPSLYTNVFQNIQWIRNNIS